MENTQTQSQTLFQRLGGMPAVDAAVDIFYGKVMRDNRVSHFFQHIDMEKQAGKLKGFMAFAFGAPIPYHGKPMREAHRHMHLTDEHFAAVAGHLAATLDELHVPSELIEEVMTLVGSTKADVLNQ